MPWGPSVHGFRRQLDLKSIAFVRAEGAADAGTGQLVLRQKLTHFPLDAGERCPQWHADLNALGRRQTHRMGGNTVHGPILWEAKQNASQGLHQVGAEMAGGLVVAGR